VRAGVTFNMSTAYDRLWAPILVRLLQKTFGNGLCWLCRAPTRDTTSTG
jgi:hypothetical protein